LIWIVTDRSACIEKPTGAGKISEPFLGDVKGASTYILPMGRTEQSGPEKLLIQAVQDATTSEGDKRLFTSPNSVLADERTVCDAFALRPIPEALIKASGASSQRCDVHPESPSAISPLLEALLASFRENRAFLF
jgi:hypothetical protein